MGKTTCVSRISISLVLCFSICGVSAFAQGVDPNLQTQIDQLVPRPEREAKVLKRETETVETPIVEERRLTPEQRKERLFAELQRQGVVLPMGVREMNDAELARRFKSTYDRIPFMEKRIVGYNKIQVKKPRSVAKLAITTANYVYDSNANKSKTAAIVDRLAVIGLTGLIQIPVGSDEDTITFSVGTSSLRYDNLVTRDIDVISGLMRYGTTLYRRELPDVLTELTTTRDILTISLNAQTARRADFSSGLADTYGPSINLSKSNMPLGTALCWNNTAYCNFFSGGVTLQHNWSDVSTQENASAKIEGTIGWRTDPKLTLSATGSVVFRHFTHVAGDRNDLIYEISGNAEWELSWNAFLSANIKFTQQKSSIPGVEWDGYAINPGLRLRILLP